MLTWLKYTVEVAAILWVAAFILEFALRSAGRGTRWSWFAALTLSIVIPAVSYFTPAHVTATGGAIITAMSAGAPAGTAATVRTSLSIAPVVWIALTICVLAYIFASHLVLMRARRRWTPANVQDVSVLLSEDVGPAALGVITQQIVLPRWVLSLEARALQLMLLHEREHIRAGDPRMMLGALIVAALMPWNPFTWLMVMRLRRAIEMDCDARVLRRDPDPATYGAVLLEVGRRRATRTLALATFAEPRSHLEERIRRMMQWPGHTRVMRASAFAVIALAVATGAYAVRGPIHARTIVDPAPAQDQKPHLILDARSQVSQPRAPEALSGTMRSDGDTVPPRLANADDMTRVLNRNYPPLLRDAGITGAVAVRVHITPAGLVDKSEVRSDGGYPAFAEAALKSVASMRFTPAVSAGRRVATWTDAYLIFGPEAQKVELARQRMVVDTVVELSKDGVARDTVMHIRPRVPLLQEPGTNEVRERVPLLQEPRLNEVHVRTPRNETPAAIPLQLTERPRTNEVRDRVPDDGPVITPMTVPPRLLNPDDVRDAISGAYPRLLRDAGIGGTTTVWFYIDSTGKSTRQMVKTSSGREELDAAALKIAPVLRFSPARNNDATTPVWVAIPIVFSVK